MFVLCALVAWWPIAGCFQSPFERGMMDNLLWFSLDDLLGTLNIAGNYVVAEVSARRGLKKEGGLATTDSQNTMQRLASCCLDRPPLHPSFERFGKPLRLPALTYTFATHHPFRPLPRLRPLRASPALSTPRLRVNFGGLDFVCPASHPPTGTQCHQTLELSALLLNPASEPPHKQIRHKSY